MTHLLAHLGFATTAGVYVAGDKAYITHIAITPMGPREISRTIKRFDLNREESMAEQLAEALDEMAPNTVALSLPTRECYLATRPMAMNSTAISPKVLLRESMRSSSAATDGMLADTHTLKPGKRQLVTIAGCPRRFILDFGEAAESRPWRFVLAEPAPLSLLRQTPHKRKGACIHVYLGGNEALSVLSWDGDVLLWNLATLNPGDEATLVLSQVRALQTVAAASGIDTEIDRAIVRGRADLRSLVDVQWVEEELNLTFSWEDVDLANAATYATGAAYGVVQEAESINLARPFKTYAKFREVFPWRELVMYAVMLLGMAGLLRIRHNDILSQSATLISANPQAASQTSSTIDKERSALQARVSNAQKFVDTRVSWTACVRDVASSLPSSVVLTSIAGDAEFSAKRGRGKKGMKRSLVLKGAVTVKSAGLIPHEIDRLLVMLRDNPRLTKEFGVIELADLKQFEKQGAGDGEFAMFTIICLPKVRGTSKA